MKFKEIAKRITGISTPFFGVSWNPDNTERDHAKEVIAFLEDRRVLFVPSEVEIPMHCVESILRIRECLTRKIGKLDQDSELSKSLRAMRAACRKFLDITGENNDLILFGAHRGHYASWEFISAVGGLREVFGLHIARIAVAYGIDIEEDLASILPGLDTDDVSFPDDDIKMIKSPKKKISPKKK
jgi:hypothetical protein